MDYNRHKHFHDPEFHGGEIDLFFAPVETAGVQVQDQVVWGEVSGTEELLIRGIHLYKSHLLFRFHL